MRTRQGCPCREQIASTQHICKFRTSCYQVFVVNKLSGCHVQSGKVLALYSLYSKTEQKRKLPFHVTELPNVLFKIFSRSLCASEDLQGTTYSNIWDVLSGLPAWAWDQHVPVVKSMHCKPRDNNSGPVYVWVITRNLTPQSEHIFKTPRIFLKRHSHFVSQHYKPEFHAYQIEKGKVSFRLKKMLQYIMWTLDFW